jgi:hypothetical protein
MLPAAKDAYHIDWPLTIIEHHSPGLAWLRTTERICRRENYGARRESDRCAIDHLRNMTAGEKTTVLDESPIGVLSELN